MNEIKMMIDIGIQRAPLIAAQSSAVKSISAAQAAALVLIFPQKIEQCAKKWDRMENLGVADFTSQKTVYVQHPPRVPLINLTLISGTLGICSFHYANTGKKD